MTAAFNLPLDLNHSSIKRGVFSRSISDRIDAVVSVADRGRIVAEIVAELEANPPVTEDRPGRSVSASAVGDECARRVQLNIWPTFHPDAPAPKKLPLTDKSRVIFARGHRTEPLVAAWLKAAGFYLLTHTKDADTGEQKQFGFAVAGGQIKGFADGLIGEHLPSETLQAPLSLWEHKTIHAKNFRAVAKHGVLKQYPKYDAQVQFLMAYLDLPAALFSFLCAETDSKSTAGELYFELVAFDAHRAQAVSDRAVWILKATRAGELLPRCAAPQEGESVPKWPCSWCQFSPECWDV